MNKQLFMSHVAIQDDECWKWTGSTTRNGYGKCAHNGRTLGAHVTAYLLFHGDLPQGRIVTHTCDKRICVNPAHLQAGTYTSNMKDAKERGRVGRLPILTQEQALRCFSLVEKGLPLNYIATLFGVTPGCISSIINGRTWQHLNVYGKGKPLLLKKLTYKYTDAEIDNIKKLYIDGVPISKISSMTGIGYGYIWKIVKGLVRSQNSNIEPATRLRVSLEELGL